VFPLNITTSDKVQLDAFQWMNPSQKDIKEEDQKWLLWLNPNGASYEEEFGFLMNYGRDIGANVLAFNYRFFII
jgi:hypothetical protein